MTLAPQISHDSEREQQLLAIIESDPTLPKNLTQAVKEILFRRYDQLIKRKKK